MTNRRKVGMTSSPHGPYGQGYTRTTMAGTEGRQPVRGSQSHKTGRSPDRSLQLDSVKSESLVIADQNAAGLSPAVSLESPTKSLATKDRGCARYGT